MSLRCTETLYVSRQKETGINSVLNDTWKKHQHTNTDNLILEQRVAVISFDNTKFELLA